MSKVSVANSNMESDSSHASSSDGKSKTVCFLCRQRKTKCDRRLPQCGFCVKAKVQCNYVPRPKKRGLRAGYVSELEARIESLEKEMETIKHEPQALPHAKTPVMSVARPMSIESHTIPPNGGTPSTSLSAWSGVSSRKNDAVSDMMTLPRTYFHTLVDLWFKETQVWVPILSRHQLETSLNALPDPVDVINDIVLRAVIALEIAYSSQAICLGYSGRRRLSLFLRSQVINEAISTPSFSSLQALLIIAILDYGSDDISSTFSLLAICRRMSEHIGIYRQLLNRIEAESPAQVGPPGREAFGGDEKAIPLTWCTLSLEAVSSLGVSWRDASAALIDHLSSIAYLSTPDYRDSFRTHIHLAAIGLQPVHEFFFAYAQGQYAVLDEQTAQVCEDIYQNLMAYVQGLPATNYTLLENGTVDFDICHTFTRIVAHATAIMVYQRYLLESQEFDFSIATATSVARQRCLASYQEVIALIRNISDADAEVNSPVFASFICVAARFKLTLDRASQSPRDPLFDILMHGLNMCGRRWPLARRLDIVLRAAIVEVDKQPDVGRNTNTTVGTSSKLPEVFWDLRKSGLDMSEEMKAWVRGHQPSLYMGSLNGPYG